MFDVSGCISHTWETRELLTNRKKRKWLCVLTGSSFTRGAQGPICPNRESRVRDGVQSPSARLELGAGQEHPRWMTRKLNEKKWIKGWRRGRLGGGGGARGGEDEQWADGLSFYPSLSDAPFNVLTETTWGTPREAVCLFISVRWGGVGCVGGAVDGCQRLATSGWLTETDGPLPDGVSLSRALGKPAVRSSWYKRSQTGKPFVSPSPFCDRCQRDEYLRVGESINASVLWMI